MLIFLGLAFSMMSSCSSGEPSFVRWAAPSLPLFGSFTGGEWAAGGPGIKEAASLCCRSAKSHGPKDCGVGGCDDGKLLKPRDSPSESRSAGIV